MIVKATNSQALLMAEAGIEFVRISKSCYALSSSTTMRQLKQVGLTVRRV